MRCNKLAEAQLILWMGVKKSKSPEHIHRGFPLSLFRSHEEGWTRGSHGIDPEDSVPCWESKLWDTNHENVSTNYQGHTVGSQNIEIRCQIDQMPDSRLIRQSRARMQKSKHRWIMTVSTYTQNWTRFHPEDTFETKMRQVWSRSQVNYY